MKINTGLNKTIALIVAVITGIILLHNLYMYEINYGVYIETPEHAVAATKQAAKNNDDTKGPLAVLIVMNAFTVASLIFDYYRQDNDNKWYPRKFRFDLGDLFDDYLPLAIFCFFTYVADGLIAFGLLSYLVYLIL